MPPSLENLAISGNDDVMLVPRLGLFIGKYFTLKISILNQYRTQSLEMKWKLLPTMTTRTLYHCFRCCYYDTTMPRRVAAKIVSDAVAKSQLANAYYLARRSRLQQLSQVEERKLVSALSNQSEPFGWSLTTGCRVSEVSTGWRISLRKRPGGKSKVKSDRKRSKEYQSQIAAKMIE